MGVGIYERIRRLDDFVRHCFVLRRLWVCMTPSESLGVSWQCFAMWRTWEKNKAGSFRSGSGVASLNAPFSPSSLFILPFLSNLSKT
jgi:hypothetical protein